MAPKKHRILIVDDNRDIHVDFRKMLTPSEGEHEQGLSDLEADLFGGEKQDRSGLAVYELESVYQGKEGYEKVLASVESGDRFSMAFVDMRMPPGWDGLQTIEKIWEADPEIQVVICSAYSDYSWEDILTKLGTHDRLLILKKPFDTVEVCQLACALTEKWHLAKHAHLKLNQLKSMVDERTIELRTANQRLQDEVNERRSAEQSLLTSVTRYQTSFELAGVGKAHVDPGSGRLLQVNRKLCDVTGYTREELVGMSVVDLTHPDDRPATEVAFRLITSGQTKNYSGEKRYVCKGGRVAWVNVTAALVTESETSQPYMVAVIQDVTDRRVAEEQLRHDAMHDVLTGLSNRALLSKHLARCLSQQDPVARGKCAVLYLDLDRFKSVNDVFGHPVGDQLLIGVADRLAQVGRESVRSISRDAGAHVARLGGDEFVMLLEGLNAPEDAVEVAGRIRAALSQPFRIDGNEVNTLASVGIAFLRAEYGRPEEVLRDADTALYQAKLNRGSFSIFDQSMHESALSRWNLEAALRGAVERNELALHYQPVVSLETGRLAEFEVLVRWHHPQRGLLSPATFIPLAEEAGQIGAIGTWVLTEACKQAAIWAALSPLCVPVAVNLSARQLVRPELAQTVRDILSSTGLSPDRLRLELTESAFVENTGAAARTAQALAEMGIQMHLDDFGTGYSSLSYLHRIPVSVLKIDRSFVATMDQDLASRSIVQVIFSLARTLDIEVIAEGVETEAQAQALRAMNCRYAQGFFFSRPLTTEKATEYLLNGPSASTLGALAA